MVLSQPWFLSQSEMFYGKMCTRVGSIDFDIKLKLHLKKLMPGFVPFYGAILLIKCSHKPKMSGFSRSKGLKGHNSAAS